MTTDDWLLLRTTLRRYARAHDLQDVLTVMAEDDLPAGLRVHVTGLADATGRALFVVSLLDLDEVFAEERPDSVPRMERGR